MYYANEIIERINKNKHIAIYGARIVAKEVANCLLKEPYNVSIESFIVSDMKENPRELLGIPVISVEEAQPIYQDALVLVAVVEKYMDEILATLDKYGFNNVLPLGFESEEWAGIRGNYFLELRKKQGKTYLTLEEELEKISIADYTKDEKVSVYMAKCHVDKKLNADFLKYDWEIPIQVGTDLTDQRISNVCDNIGDNISKKNREYCELTALYWIWKNDQSAYAGLCHYRRHFKIGRKEIQKLVYSDIDVILTIPILNFPSVRDTYCNDHIESDWDIMLQAIKTLQPEYYDTANIVQKGIFYYGYNMLIARKKILDEYCAWLFPILDYCEKRCGTKSDTYQNRYIGFLAERLFSIYFIHNEDKYKIVHAEKEFFAK